MIAPKTSPLGGLPRLRNVRSRRYSSWDRTGGNDDRLHIQPGETAVLADIPGAGTVTHIWVTIGSAAPVPETQFLRKLVLRAFWDGETSPSVEAPIGDFFGVGHAETVNFSSLPLQMSPQDGKAFNCWFPMPFADGARFEVHSDCDGEINFYYYVDCELYPDAAPVEGMGRFHAQWRRQNPADGVSDEGLTNAEYEFGGENIGGAGNYVLLEATGQGHYVGCNLNFHNLREGPNQEWPAEIPWPPESLEDPATRELLFERFNWYGEGDDMIFIDGEEWPPSLHGTGTEDYFNTAWCPAEPYSAPYHGLTLPGGPNWSGKISMYRFHVEDPVYFQQSIKVTIEHGHDNRRSDDMSSTAYWYQAEPHSPFPALPPVAERLPRT